MIFLKISSVFFTLFGIFLGTSALASEEKIEGYIQSHRGTNGESIYSGQGIAIVKSGGCSLQMKLLKNEKLFLDEKKRYISLNYKPPTKISRPEGDSGYYDFRCYMDDTFSEELKSTKELYTGPDGNLGISAENTRSIKNTPELQMHAVLFSGKNWEGIAITKTHIKPGTVVFMSSQNVDFCIFGENQGLCGSADIDDLEKSTSNSLERMINQLKHIEFVKDSAVTNQ